MGDRRNTSNVTEKGKGGHRSRSSLGTGLNALPKLPLNQGDEVVVYRLSKDPFLNGEAVRLLRYQVATESWEVHVLTGKHSGTKQVISEDNLADLEAVQYEGAEFISRAAQTRLKNDQHKPREGPWQPSRDSPKQSAAGKSQGSQGSSGQRSPAQSRRQSRTDEGAQHSGDSPPGQGDNRASMAVPRNAPRESARKSIAVQRAEEEAQKDPPRAAAPRKSLMQSARASTQGLVTAKRLGSMDASEGIFPQQGGLSNIQEEDSNNSSPRGRSNSGLGNMNSPNSSKTPAFVKEKMLEQQWQKRPSQARASLVASLQGKGAEGDDF